MVVKCRGNVVRRYQHHSNSSFGPLEFSHVPTALKLKVRDALVFGRVLLHVKASKQTHLEKMSIFDMNINGRIWGLPIHIFDYFRWSRYCKDMAGNFFQKEAKADFSFNLFFVLNPSISELMGFHVD